MFYKNSFKEKRNIKREGSFLVQLVAEADTNKTVLSVDWNAYLCISDQYLH